MENTKKGRYISHMNQVKFTFSENIHDQIWEWENCVIREIRCRDK